MALLVLAVVLAVMAFGAARDFLDGFRGDFYHFYHAALAVVHGEDVYESGTGAGYIYPPYLAVGLVPLTALPYETAGALFVLVNLVLTACVLVLGSREVARRFDGGHGRMDLSLVMLLAALTFFGRIKSELDLGQTDALVLVLVLLSLRWLDRSPARSGLALAAAGAVKYQTLLFVVYLAIRGKWRQVGYAAAGLALFPLLGVGVFGWERHADYLRRAMEGVAGMMGTVERGAGATAVNPLTWSRSISIPSVLARLADDPASGARLALVGSVIVGSLALGLTLLIYRHYRVPVFGSLRRGPGRAGDGVVALEYAGLLVALAAFSPQTTLRHLYVVLFAGLVAAYLLVVPGRVVARWPLILATIAMVLAQILPPPGEARLLWRGAGGPTGVLLVYFFVLLATGLAWLASADTGGRSPRACEERRATGVPTATTFRSRSNRMV